MRAFKLVSGIMLGLTLLLVSSCGGGKTTDTAKLDTIRLVGTIGPMSIPLAYMVEHNSLASVANKTTLDIWANPTQLQAIVASGQGDFVSLPTNSAATFYNKGISLQLLDSSIWNILYIVTTDTSIKSMADLKGKRVVVPYQGAVPDAMFQTVLEVQGINPEKDLNVIYAPDPVQGSQLLLSGQENYALLSEPSATSVVIKGQAAGKTYVRALNMQTEWQKAFGSAATTPVAGTVVLGTMKDRPEVIKVFLTEYQKAVQWMLDNPEEAGKVGEKVLAAQGFKAAVLTQSMKNINWSFTTAQKAKSDLKTFFDLLAQDSPNFVGGKMPDDGFYYNK
jgi:NitT/TauT family transport system substrate-binding protein